MFKNRNLLVALVIALLAIPCIWAGTEFPANPGEPVVANQLIVKLHAGASINQLLASVVPQAVANLVSSHQNSYLLQLPPGIQAIISKALAASPTVEYVEPNRLRKINIGTPNDPSYASQWALINIQALQAWNYLPDQYLTATTAGTNRVKVAALDTGVDCTHPDFKNLGASSTDSAQGGQLLFASSQALIATKVASPTCAWQDDHGHGTHTAGIVAAATQNGTGVASVGYPLQLMIYKVLDNTGSGPDTVIAQAIESATDAGASVVSMSLGGAGYSQTLQTAIDYAWQHNTLVISAAGNSGDTTLTYPGAANHGLGVAATDINNARASFSTYGNWVKIAAPGVNILSTMPTYSTTLGAVNYASLSGTSMATPHVAAVAGLVYMANPGISAAAVAQRLQRAAQTTNAGWDQFVGYGVVNAAGAVSGTLRPATLGSLVGQVVDASNLPVTGATVIANGQSFTTAGDGLFRIANLSAGTFTLTANATGFSTVIMQAAVLSGADTMLTVRMGVSLGEFTGTVTSNGLPVTGVVVEGVSGGVIQGTAVSDANGTYALYLPSGTYDLTASTPGDINNTVASQVLVAGPPKTVNLTISRLGNIVGVVKDSNGNPVVAAHVDIANAGFSAGATADASGTFSSVGIPSGTYTVTASSAGFNNVSMTGVTVSSGVSTPVTLQFSTAPALTTGLTGYWNFDEGSGSIAHDTSGNGYNGVINGPTWTTGKINSALTFSGSANAVVTPNISLGATFSISAWVNSAAAFQGYYSRIAETNYATGFLLGVNTNGSRYKFIVNSGTGSTGTCGLAYGCAEGGVVTSGWHQVTATYDGASAKLYVDSAFVASDTFTAPSNTSLPLYIGQAFTGSGYGWNGGIDEVRLYGRALTVAEVSALYNYTGGPSDTSPPTVSITAPIANTTVSNTITVTATASDNVAVADVQFQLDGVNLGADLTTAPYSISWNTTTASNGSHNLTAIARDTSHNTATSATVLVTVSNTTTGPPTAGLIGYWNFDEGTGSIAHDTSGNGHNGAINGATWTTGKINSALNFSGSANSVVTPNIALVTTFSISAWVNSAVPYQGYYTRIAETHYGVGFFLGVNTNGARYKFIVNSGSGSTGSCEYGCAEGGVVAGGWHLVTATYDGASAKLYVDGALAASDTFTAPSNTSLPLYIGQAFTGSSYGWNGGIDEVRLYNRALTVAEVSAIYNNTGGPPDTTPPTVSITAPTANTTVSNTITVTATASDNVAVADVQFQLDGVNLGADLTAPPYSISWNTTTASNGSHNLTAIARDTSHNAATSAVVPVTVSNTVTGPPTAGLIGYWNFDEGTGSVAHDTSGSGYNGAINGPTWTTGKINAALNFGGSTNSVVTPNIALGTTFSISAWVNSAAPYQGYYTRIAETHYGVGFFLGVNTNGARYKFIVNSGSGSTGSCEYGCAEGGVVTSGWHLVTATYDGASAKLYVDGALAASDTFTAPSNTSLPLYIGQAFTGSSYGWNGGIDEVRLYNRALTVAEVSAIYNNTGGPSDTTPPSVSVTAPTANTTVSNTITVTATASDNVAVADVQFQLDGVNLGADLTAPPYSISWNTTTASNGIHNLTAIARDTSHNAATSAVVPVTVSNTVTGPPTAGLIGYWNFDEGTGSIAHDTSGNGNNGAINGPTWTTGKINSGLSFSGSTNSVVTPNIALGATFSISAWVNSAVPYQGYYTRIAETHYGVGFFLGVNTNGARYKFIVNSGSGSTGSCEYGCAEGGAVTGGWHLVTATYDGASAKLYVDNALVASDTFTAPGNTNRPLYIGQAYTGSAYGWNGPIDEVRMYNRALTAAEVSAIFNH